MKRVLLTIVPLATAALLSSCFKNDIEPVSGKNSSIEVKDIAFHGLAAAGFPELQGVAQFDFYVQNVDTPGAPLDHVSYRDTFDILDATGLNQHYDFDTPEKTKTFKFNMLLKIKGGYAQNVTGGNITYKWNGTTYLNSQAVFTGNMDSTFVMTEQVVNF